MKKATKKPWSAYHTAYAAARKSGLSHKAAVAEGKRVAAGKGEPVPELHGPGLIKAQIATLVRSLSDEELVELVRKVI